MPPDVGEEVVVGWGTADGPPAPPSPRAVAATGVGVPALVHGEQSGLDGLPLPLGLGGQHVLHRVGHLAGLQRHRHARR
ncbi:MAG: hypothetical protein ACRYG2_01915 [Janthinobacterium lividum]